MTGTAGRRAEIVGAGFAGLMAAAALAARGWTVRVHEKGPEVRAYGSSLALSENGLKALEAVGAYDEAVEGAFRLRFRETRDADGALIARYDWTTEDRRLRMFMMLRSRVIRALARAAIDAGAEIVTSSEGMAATPDGVLTLRSGPTRRADLVVVADGAASRIRTELGLLKTQRWFADGSIRMLLPISGELPTWGDGVFAEYWAPRRRCMLVPCSEKDFYAVLIARQDDREAIRTPIDKKLWTATFPGAAAFIERIGDQERWSWDRYQSIILKQWHRGKVAVIGDAAHAMSPNFGQGGALAMVSALSLAATLEEFPEVERALPLWEQRERKLIDRTQFLSGLYSSLATWPDWARSSALWAMGRSRWIMRQRTLAAYHTPKGFA